MFAEEMSARAFIKDKTSCSMACFLSRMALFNEAKSSKAECVYLGNIYKEE